MRTFALPFPEVAGIGVALVEIAIGVLAFAGLFTRAAAVGGLALSALLFLTATWSTRPYFLGSDIVFAFAWLPFALTGARGQPGLDNVDKRALGLAWRSINATRRVPVPELKSGPAVSRRALLVQALGATAFATLGIAGVARLTREAYRPAAPAGSESGSSGASAPAGESQLTDAVEIGPSSALRPGDSLTYLNPDNGSPDIAVRTPDGALAAFSALCTHAGCEVAYRGEELRCPCHGAVFDARDGRVKAGPAPWPLPRRQVAERGGRIYALPR